MGLKSFYYRWSDYRLEFKIQTLFFDAATVVGLETGSCWWLGGYFVKEVILIFKRDLVVIMTLVRTEIVPRTFVVSNAEGSLGLNPFETCRLYANFGTKKSNHWSFG
jgi:hypothetical protein